MAEDLGMKQGGVVMWRMDGVLEPEAKAAYERFVDKMREAFRELDGVDEQPEQIIRLWAMDPMHTFAGQLSKAMAGLAEKMQDVTDGNFIFTDPIAMTMEMMAREKKMEQERDGQN